MARVALFLALLLLPRAARAFTIETPITPGCHEAITEDAWRRARSALPETTARLPSLGDDQALIDDVPFGLPDDLDDIGAVTLLLGVRDNDVKGMAVTALDQMAGVNAEPAYQKEHCLRRADQNEPGGSEAALDDCRAFIRAMLLSSLEGMDDSGHPDGNKREPLEVTLAIRGKVRVRVPIFALRAGRGLHALEDSFTHTFRSVADPHKVTVVLNWIEYADNDLDEKTDGPPHLKELDRCDDPDDLRTERHRLAVEAATAALVGLLDPKGSYETRAVAIDAVLDQYVSFDKSQSCSEANHWCDAPELDYVPSGCGCRVIGSGSSATSIALVSLVLAGMMRRARKRWKPGRGLTLAMLIGSLAAPRIASADPSSESSTSLGPAQGPVAALSGESNAGAPGKKDQAGAFFARVAFGASYDKPGFSGGAGLRYQISTPYMLGFDAE
ncbi:MAG TPA: hypothetical protein VGP93_12045, partial [Polyangiaceae bacterium]|nr:hypothetical protein [Polyangiaceae bacterium]